jgi:Chalcone isomerase-like
MKNLLCVLAACISLGTAWAQNTSPPPSEIQTTVSQAELRGQGLFTYFGLAIYEAKLWTAPGFAPSNFERFGFALELQYKRALEGIKIAERSLAEIKKQGALKEAQAQEWLAHMVSAFPDVNKNDRITGVYQPGVSVRFYFNGQLRSEIKDPEFAKRFFGIWLASKTTAPQLRAQLVGQDQP